MAHRRRIAVVGLNTFGHALMHALSEHGQECLGVDVSRDVVQHFAAEFPSVMEVDATSVDALIAAGIKEYDLAVVTLGTDLAASVLATPSWALSSVRWVCNTVWKSIRPLL